MAVSTVGEYLSALEKSKLLGSEQLVEAQRLAGESSDASTLAKALARENLVSRWQASILLDLGKRAQLRLGKYKLIQRLGKGGMGTVFLAEHVTMNRRVALKIVPRSIAENRASLDRFFSEARAIAALDHPNIVQAYSVDNEMDRYFIVMEFVDGQDLQRMVELNGPMDFEHAADYIRQTAEGLAHAHVHNLVHCDIKPSNLLVNHQGVIKILDLGLARLNRSDEPRGAAAGEPAFGTVDYMAPEQGLGTTNFDHRADIYSLGCTLYFLLTGHPPFPEGTLAQRIVKHQTQEPRDILLERPDTPPKLVDICKRMMAKEPENRYQSIREVSAALAPWQPGNNGEPGGHTPLAVKPLDDAASAAPPADDWLSSLTVPSKSTATTNGAKAPASTATTTKPGRSTKEQNKKGKPSAGIAAALAGVMSFGRAKLGWFNTPKRKIVGAAAVTALLAAVAGLAALPYLLSHPKPAPQIAVALKPEDKKGTVEPDVGPPPDKSTEKKPDASGNSSEKEAPEPKTDVPKKPKDSSKGPPKPPDAEIKPVVPPIIKPDTNPAPKPSATPTPVKPPPVKPAEPDKPPPPKPVSLDGLLTEVDLPPLGKHANEVVSLGKLGLDPKLALDIKLLGGNTVAKGNPKFELQKDGDGATPGWSLQMAGKNKDAVKIARLWQEGNEWKIQWNDEAKDKATLVRYCGLQFSCASAKPHFVALTKPKTVAPLLVDLDTGASRTRLSRDFPLPDLSVLRLQILPLDQALPKHEIKILESKGHGGRPGHGKPAEAVKGDKVPVKGHAFVVFTKEKPPRIFVSVAFDAHAKDVQLDMQVGCDILGNLPLNGMNLQEAANRVDRYLLVTDSDKNPNKKNMQGPIQAAKATKDELKALRDLGAELDQKASIPYQVYAVLGEKTEDGVAPKVVIFKSGDVEKPKTGWTKKTPKGNNPKSNNSKGNKSKGHVTPDSEELDLSK